MKELRAIKRIIKLKNLKIIYEKLLNRAKESNIKVFNERQFYEFFVSYKLLNKRIDEPILVLKHDVDHTLASIRIILEIEHRFGVSSTFHVRADEKKYHLKDAQLILQNQDIALHQVNDPSEEKEKLLKYFGNIIGVSTHGGYESSTVFNDNLLRKLSSDFQYISDGLLRPRKISFLNNMLLVPIDSADIYFENLILKLEKMIKEKEIMVFNTHVEYFSPFNFLISELTRKFR